MASHSSASRPPAGGTLRVARPRKATIGAYKIVGRPLGRGGSATVYRVAGLDGREFAMKELAPQFLGDKDAIARFRREFEISSGLDHPGVVRMFELLEANGTLNLRMELIDGFSLKWLIGRRKRLDPPLAAWIAVQLGRVLAHAHARQIVHRDVKPDNVLIDRAGTVRLGDFGTARLTNMALTRAGTLLGTPIYMAPELLAGKKDSVATPASDIYSLGAVLYECIEGRAPFAAGRRGELLPLLYAKSFQKLRPMAAAGDGHLSALIESCLAREPGARPQDIGRFLEVLEPHAGKAAPHTLRTMVAEGLEKPQAGAKDGRRKRRAKIVSLHGRDGGANDGKHRPGLLADRPPPGSNPRELPVLRLSTHDPRRTTRPAADDVSSPHALPLAQASPPPSTRLAVAGAGQEGGSAGSSAAVRSEEPAGGEGLGGWTASARPASKILRMPASAWTASTRTRRWFSPLSIHDGRFAVLFFAMVAGLIVYLLTLTPAAPDSRPVSGPEEGPSGPGARATDPPDSRTGRGAPARAGRKVSP